MNTTPVFKRKVYLLFVKSQNITGFLSVLLTESILKKSIHIPLQGPFAKQMEQPMQVDIQYRYNLNGCETCRQFSCKHIER